MKKRILFIEDEEHLQKLAVSALQEAGYEVLSAYDGEAGIKILEERKLDLILLDLILPKKDGFDVLAYMRSKEEMKNIPVIVLTNLEEKFDIGRAMKYGIRAYLVKANYSLDEVISKIKEILGNES
ncbi:response regulator [Patescibacteria group bacterium]|nr:response regulator [Patescibacteria group bacterium]